MKNRFAILVGVMFLLSLTLQACGGTPAPATNPPQPAATQPPATVAPTDTATQPPVAPTATTAPQPTQPQHVTKPTSPTYILDQTVGDCVEGEKYDPNKPVHVVQSCDLPDVGLLERPMSQDKNSYYPYLDIVRTQFGASRDWLFVRVVIFSDTVPAGGDDVSYTVKLDFAMDGRNSNVTFFSVTNLPASAANWTTNGVNAWTSVDGTTTQIFGAGVNSDPDLVWARRSPKAIEFAFKPAMINNVNRFAWYSWAYQGSQAIPDLVLAMSLPDVFSLDNTCAFGFNIGLGSINLPNKCLQ